MLSLLKMIAIEAPSNLGLKPPKADALPGVYRLPDALRKTSLYQQLDIQDIIRVPAPTYFPDIDPATGIRNAPAIRVYSQALADNIEKAVQAEQFPLVIGGDCSILLGAMLGLRRLGNYGLFFVDGHTDFQTPKTSATGGAAGMDLALVTGYGSELLTTIDGFHPLIDEKCVVALGCRDIDDLDTYPAKLIFDTGVQLHPLDAARQRGLVETVIDGIDYLKQRQIDGIWLHIDVDVLDSDLMPAVDSPQPDGMSYEELTTVIQTLSQSRLLCGLQITILDPDLDSDGQIIATFANVLANALTPA